MEGRTQATQLSIPPLPLQDYLPLELPPFLFILLISGLEIALKLALEGLHVDLEPQFGIFCCLQLILQLFQLCLHLLHLGFQGSLGLLQLMDLYMRVDFMKMVRQPQ